MSNRILENGCIVKVQEADGLKDDLLQNIVEETQNIIEETQEKKIKEHQNMLAENQKLLEEHQKLLEEHQNMLAEHQNRLKENEKLLKENEKRLAKNKLNEDDEGRKPYKSVTYNKGSFHTFPYADDDDGGYRTLCSSAY